MLIVFTVLSCGQCGQGTGSEPGGHTRSPGGRYMVHVFQSDFLNFKFSLSEHRDSGAAAPALQQSLEQQPLPVACGLPGVQWHWGPWDGAPACQLRAHTHTVTSTDLLVTREQSSRWRKDGAARDGSRAPRDGMGWRVLKQGKNKGRRM